MDRKRIKKLFFRISILLIIVGLLYQYFPNPKKFFLETLLNINKEKILKPQNSELLILKRKGWVFWKKITINPNNFTNWEETPKGMEKAVIFPNGGWYREKHPDGNIYTITGNQTIKFPQSSKFMMEGGVGENSPIECWIIIRTPRS